MKGFPSDQTRTFFNANVRRRRKESPTSVVIGLLTGPHQTSFSEFGSLTMRLSSGDRPVFAPEKAVNAPVEVIAEPVSYTNASS